MNDYDYPKPEAAIYNLQRIVGKGESAVFHNHRHDMCELSSIILGVLLVEGDVHRKQVRNQSYSDNLLDLK